tara:strand:+ start:385 stop:618 length:234 start_codon:yes stop_codon:yes gene_type:complete
MEKTDLITLQGHNQDIAERVRYSYAHFYSVSLGTFFLFLILMYLNSFDKSKNEAKFISFVCSILILVCVFMIYILNY